MTKRPPIAWRHSSIAVLLGSPDHHIQQRYRGCSYSFQQEYLRGLEPDSGDPATVGIVNHSIAAAWARWLVRRKIKFSQYNAHKFIDRYQEVVEAVIQQENAPAHLHDDIRDNALLWFYSFEMKQPDATHIFERRMYFTMDWQPLVPLELLDDRDAVKAAIIAERDAGRDHFGMTADHIWFSNPAELHFSDLKFGDTARHLDVTENARQNEQLQVYARGLLAMFPAAEIVHGSIWGVKGGSRNVSEASWVRGGVEDIVQERIDKAVATADALWLVYGESDYPATPDNSVCRFCSVVGGCPLVNDMMAAIQEAM